MLRLAVATLSLACLTSGVRGADEPDQPSPRRSHIQPVGEVAAASGNTDTLGLRLARASEVLRQQLALARGAGLVVEEVLPGSVADRAGFKRYDVLVLLDDQMLLLPEQLTALLEAADGTSLECTVLRGGTKVTISLGEPGRNTRPSLPALPKPVGPPAIAAAPQPTLPAVRQTAAKPSTRPGLRAPASALAIVQPTQAGQPAGVIPGLAAKRTAGSTEETLLREDTDFHIKLSRGDQTRLVVLDPRGRILFNDEIDTPEHRSLVPPAVRDRVEAMERSLEAGRSGPTAEIGRLDAAPIEIR
ncbi:MAG: hypothetical protein ACKO6B_17640 [Planctomycetia bacterium]